MKSMLAAFGEDWRSVDATHLDNIDTRRDIAGEQVGAFSLAVRALLRSLCRLDAGHLGRWTEARYQPLRVGMFTIGDVCAEAEAWATGKYVYGFAAKSRALLSTFFCEGLDEREPVNQTPGALDNMLRLISEYSEGALAVTHPRAAPLVQREALRSIVIYARACRELIKRGGE